MDPLTGPKVTSHRTKRPPIIDLVGGRVMASLPRTVALRPTCLPRYYAPALTCARDSGPDGHFEYAVALPCKQVVRLRDLVQREAVRQQRAQVDAPVLHQAQQRLHALFATGAERIDDALVAQAADVVGRRD